MMYLAPSYKDWKFNEEDIFEVEGKKYVVATHPCHRCCHGHYPSLVDNGICWTCGGTGIERDEVRVYTEKEYNRMVRATEKRRERAAAKEQARVGQLKNDSEKNFAEWCEKNGINREGFVYVAIGDTYKQKCALRELGCRYNALFGWHTGKYILDVPVGVHFMFLDIHTIGTWDWRAKTFFYNDNAGEVVKEKIEDAMKSFSDSRHIGEVGERLRDMDAVLYDKFATQSAYGNCFIYTFLVDDNKVVWVTSAEKEIEVGECVSLTGTVKKHEIRNGEQVTTLSRCIIK